MKFLRVFETEQQRTTVLNNATHSILHKLAGTDGVTLTIKRESVSRKIIATFNYTKTSDGGSGSTSGEGSSSLKIMSEHVNPENYFDAIYIDGEPLSELVTELDVESDEYTVEYEFKENINELPENLFNECSGLASVTIPDGVTSIGSLAFSSCTGLTSVTIPNSVASIGSDAFSSCTGLTSVTIPNSVTSIDNYVFYYCTGLTSVTIPDGVTFIGNHAFQDCTGLTSVTIPNSVTSIGNNAFQGCDRLTSVTIPNSVTSIGDHAFEYCSGLTSVTCLRETPPTIINTIFNTNCTIYVPASSVDVYKAATGWSAYASRIQAIQ